MGGSHLGCPHCKTQSFTILEIEGWQEKASFAQTEDGASYCLEANSVTVTGYNEDRLRCNGCEKVVSEEELVEVGR